MSEFYRSFIHLYVGINTNKEVGLLCRDSGMNFVDRCIPVSYVRVIRGLEESYW
jgi:hypothetical protein